VLSKVIELLNSMDKKTKLIAIFGSSIYSPRKARDIDILIAVDRIDSVTEKIELEVAIKRALRELGMEKTCDVIVFDVDSLKENMKPGGVASGAIAGYKVLYDEIGFEEMVKKAAEELLKQGVVVYKKGRKLDLTIYTKLLLSKKSIKEKEYITPL